MLRKTSQARKDENTTKKAKERMEEKHTKKGAAAEDRGRNGNTADKSSEKNIRAVVDNTAREPRRGGTDKTKESGDKKVKRDANRTNEETKAKPENSAEGKIESRVVRESSGAAENKSKEIFPTRNEKTLKKEVETQKKPNHNGGRGKRESCPGDSPNLDALVQTIHERRMSLPRTVLTEASADVEIVIGDDGKPVFHPTVTPKADEILKELTDIVLADEKPDERSPNFIHT